MNPQINVGIIGDFDPEKYFSHMATNEALKHAGNALSASVNFEWLPTLSLASQRGVISLRKFDALWCAPGSPYKSMEGALQGVRFARESALPFFAT
jgi:CTP synthase (UTP-ammonia lyase)